MTLQQLRYAIGISKVGSFNKAAESLFISQPSLTTAIHDLEDEIGIIYLSDFNRKYITYLLREHDLVFQKLIDCNAYAYMWKTNPLANKPYVNLEDLSEYPCLSFEQGESGNYYFAEEILSTNEYHRTIKANDRATMLNLMVGLNGYTLCSGIISEEINGSDYVAVPFKDAKGEDDRSMEIGYITKKNFMLSTICRIYIREMEEYLKAYTAEHNPNA